MGFVLFFVAAVLSLILYPLALVTSLIINFWKRRFKDGISRLNQQFFEIAASLDATGNVICDDLFNLVLIKKGAYKFGNRKETVSSVLGKNQLAKTLTWSGWILTKILDTIQAKHCFKSIDNQV
jgi:hypothetical protein